MLMEIMGLHLPGSSFINPYTEQDGLGAVKHAQQLLDGKRGNALADIVSEKTVINGLVGYFYGWLTNHAIHLVAMAKAAGVQITWKTRRICLKWCRSNAYLSQWPCRRKPFPSRWWYGLLDA